MPIYEYTCDQCSTRAEVLQKMDDPAPLCGKCKKPMSKMISSTTFSLKGSGWASDGYTGGRSIDEALTAMEGIQPTRRRK